MPENTTESQASKRILVVEDDQDTQEMMVLHLGGFGYDVTVAGSWTDALEFAKFGGFNLYILDLRVREVDGIELCHKIRTFDVDTPIVFYSGAAYKEDIEKGMAAGAQAYLVKPYLDTLTDTIDRLIEEPRVH